MLKKYKREFMKRIIFLSLIMFSAMFLDAQEIAKKDLHVNIKALMFGQLYSFNVDIYKSENTVKVIYSVLDNLSAKKMLDIFLANNGTDGNGTKFFINIDSIATLKNNKPIRRFAITTSVGFLLRDSQNYLPLKVLKKYYLMNLIDSKDRSAIKNLSFATLHTQELI